MTVATAGYHVVSDRSRVRNGARSKHSRNKETINEYFGISREVDLSRSPIFSRLLQEIPELSQGMVYSDNIKKPYLALANHGLVKDIFRRKGSRKGIKTQKEVRKIAGALEDLVAGRGNQEMSVDLRHLRTDVISSNRKTHIGALLLASMEDPAPGMSDDDLDQHMEVAGTASAIHGKLLKTTKSSSGMGPLEGRIDLFCAEEFDAAQDTMGKIHEISQRLNESYDTGIVMKPAEVYWVRAR